MIVAYSMKTGIFVGTKVQAIVLLTCFVTSSTRMVLMFPSNLENEYSDRMGSGVAGSSFTMLSQQVHYGYIGTRGEVPVIMADIFYSALFSLQKSMQHLLQTWRLGSKKPLQFLLCTYSNSKLRTSKVAYKQLHLQSFQGRYHTHLSVTSLLSQLYYC